MQRFGDVGEVGDEPSVEVDEPYERLDLRPVGGNHPLHYGLDLLGICGYCAIADDESQIGDGVHLEEALGGLQVELVLTKVLQHPVNNLPMQLEVLGEDEDVVQVHKNVALIDEVPKNFVHHALEGGGGVAESKEHDGGLKQSSICSKRSLPLVSLPHSHIVVPPSNVQLGEVPGILDPVDEFLDEGKGIAVLYSVFIELPTVLYWSQGSIPFENGKEWKCHW